MKLYAAPPNSFKKCNHPTRLLEKLKEKEEKVRFLKTSPPPTTGEREKLETLEQERAIWEEKRNGYPEKRREDWDCKGCYGGWDCVWSKRGRGKDDINNSGEG